MFDTILIANRGEISCRIMQTAQALGVRCVAVYSDADAGARHVQMADLAVHIGGSAPAESYLRSDVIIQAALDTGAQAIHPGYGFLSENPDFVEAVENAGMTFIGPSAEAIRAMGLKDAAKALMEQANVPVVPGYHGADQSDELLAAKADEIGYPVLIKAVAGGGGKGMRLVENATDFADALAGARSEAKAAFGNSDVLVEKFVTKPRHIEIQVFGDGAKAVHLFERDCSLQRRHQKVIEEAPAPGMTEEVRVAMGQAAVRAAEAIGYKGAGTVEFIVDGSSGLRTDGFWFMEMNTRLQVEHPVTEEITGVDLVEWQLHVASGEPLPKNQDQLAINGHAFEARLYAEDAGNDFLPATGMLTHLRFAEGARADTGVRAGDAISPFYDPMIAKLTVHGPSRAAALAKLRQALAQTEVAGTVTNLNFLHALASHDGFRAGDVDTGLIARDQEALTRRAPVTAITLAAAVLQVAGLGVQGAGLGELAPGLGEQAAGLEERLAGKGFTLWEPLRRTISLQQGEERFDCALLMDGSDKAALETPVGAVALRYAGKGWQSELGALPAARRVGTCVTVFGPTGGTFEVIDPLAQQAHGAESSDVILAPMPGAVKGVFAEIGQIVAQGDRLAVLEAMKMEHSLLSPRDGVVAEVLAAHGDQVEAGTALIRLETEAGEDT